MYYYYVLNDYVCTLLVLCVIQCMSQVTCFSAEIRSLPSRNSVNVHEIFRRASAPALQTGRANVPTAEHCPWNTVVLHSWRERFHPPGESGLAMREWCEQGVRVTLHIYIYVTSELSKEGTTQGDPLARHGNVCTCHCSHTEANGGVSNGLSGLVCR